jgi:hypothetical protein
MSLVLFLTNISQASGAYLVLDTEKVANLYCFAFVVDVALAARKVFSNPSRLRAPITC